VAGLLEVLRWLDPARSPQIVLGVDAGSRKNERDRSRT
jgi:hypothetical protein